MMKVKKNSMKMISKWEPSVINVTFTGKPEAGLKTHVSVKHKRMNVNQFAKGKIESILRILHLWPTCT